MNGQSPWGLQEFQMQDALMKRQREQQLAEALQAQQLQTVSNPLQGLAMVLKEHLWSRPRGEQKDAALSDQLAQFFAEDERRRQQEAQANDPFNQRMGYVQQAGLDPNSAEGRHYLLTGKLPTAPKDSRTSAQKHADAMGLQPGSPEYNAFLRQASGPASTNVTIQQPGQNYEKPFDTALAKADVARFDSLRSRADAARTENASLAELEQNLARTYTGFGAEQVLGLKQAALAFGVGDPEEVGAAESAKALTNKMALQMRNPAGGEGMPGAMSDKDREFLVSSIAGLRNSPDGWKQMIQYRRKLNDYTIQQAMEAERYLRSGENRMGLGAHMQEWANANPIFAGEQVPQEPQQQPPSGIDALLNKYAPQ